MNYTGMFLDCIFTVSTEHIFRTAMQQLSLIKRQKMKQKKNKSRGQSEALLILIYCDCAGTKHRSGLQMW